MLKKLFFCLIAGPSALFLTAAPSKAAVVYQYQPDRFAIDAPANSTVQVPLFLKETLSGGSGSVIVKQTGLYSAGMQIDQSAVNKPSSPSILTALVGNTTDFAGNSSKSVTPTTGFISVNNGNSFNGVLFGNTGGGATTNPAANNSIYVGMATITTGGPGTTTFSLHAISGGQTTLTNNDFYDLDFSQTGTDAYTGTSPATFTVTVAGVPEPASFGLTVLGGSMLLIRRRRSLAAHA